MHDVFFDPNMFGLWNFQSDAIKLRLYNHQTDHIPKKKKSAITLSKLVSIFYAPTQTHILTLTQPYINHRSEARRISKIGEIHHFNPV